MSNPVQTIEDSLLAPSLQKIDVPAHSSLIVMPHDGRFGKKVGYLIPQQIIAVENNTYIGADTREVVKAIHDAFTQQASNQAGFDFTMMMKLLKRFISYGEPEVNYELFKASSEVAARILALIPTSFDEFRANSSFYLDLGDSLVKTLFIYLHTSILDKGQGIKRDMEIQDDIIESIKRFSHFLKTLMFNDNTTLGRHHSWPKLSDSLYATIVFSPFFSSQLLVDYVKFDDRYTDAFALIDNINKALTGERQKIRVDFTLSIETGFHSNGNSWEQNYNLDIAESLLKILNSLEGLLKIRQTFNTMENFHIDEYKTKLLELYSSNDNV